MDFMGFFSSDLKCNFISIWLIYIVGFVSFSVTFLKTNYMVDV